MSRVDSDLEEGEIVDEPSEYFNSKKRELPRRYALSRKSSHHKHKKNCKHSVHHAKKLAKFSKTPSNQKLCQKSKYRKSRSSSSNCTIHGSLSSPKHLTPSSNSHSVAVKPKIPFENHSVLKLSPKSRWSKPEMPYSKGETTNDCSFSEMLTKYKAMRSKNSNISIHSSDQKSSVKNSEGARNVENVSLGKEINNSCNKSTLPEILKVESDDDEEELRRIALATCAKRSTNSKPTESPVPTLGASNLSLPETSEASSSVLNTTISSVKVDNVATDNYEVVDMEVEEDNQNSEVKIDDDLFIIDTKPAGCQNNLNSVEKTKLKVENCSDEDFEADILRAELIEQMYRKKMAVDEPTSAEKSLDSLHNVQNNSRCGKQVFPENSKKIESPKPSFNKSLPEMEEKKSPKRLIISLNNESSTEESEEEDRDPVNDNHVESIVALISNIRKNSNSSEKTNGDTQAVPKAVECLSKAQQLEYNALMKILAKKNVLEKPEVKNKVVHSPMDDLKVLEEKLKGVVESLDKKKKVMTGLSKEVNSKRSMYMKSKLAAQHLKEKYVFAEKQRRVHLNSWSKSCKNFENVKKSVSDMETKIAHLQDLCSKVGSSIQGKNYSLPSVETGNKQQ